MRYSCRPRSEGDHWGVNWTLLKKTYNGIFYCWSKLPTTGFAPFTLREPSFTSCKGCSNVLTKCIKKNPRDVPFRTQFILSHQPIQALLLLRWASLTNKFWDLTKQWGTVVVIVFHMKMRATRSSTNFKAEITFMFSLYSHTANMKISFSCRKSSIWKRRVLFNLRPHERGPYYRRVLI